MHYDTGLKIWKIINKHLLKEQGVLDWISRKVDFALTPQASEDVFNKWYKYMLFHVYLLNTPFRREIQRAVSKIWDQKHQEELDKKEKEAFERMLPTIKSRILTTARRKITVKLGDIK